MKKAKEKGTEDIWTLATNNVGLPPSATAYCRVLVQEVERLTRKIERERAAAIVSEAEEVFGTMGLVRHYILKGKSDE